MSVEEQLGLWRIHLSGGSSHYSESACWCALFCGTKQKSNLPNYALPKHLLTGLTFLKIYGTEHVPAALIGSDEKISEYCNSRESMLWRNSKWCVRDLIRFFCICLVLLLVSLGWSFINWLCLWCICNYWCNRLSHKGFDSIFVKMARLRNENSESTLWDCCVYWHGHDCVGAWIFRCGASGCFHFLSSSVLSPAIIGLICCSRRWLLWY